MARALVTGATGFIGYHVAKALKAKGQDVRALVREGSDTSILTALDVEPAPGDLRDYHAVLRATKGCDQVYHAGADYRLWVPDPETMYAINVQGTANVMQAALETGVAKVVYTSTVGILAPAKGGKPGSEDAPARLQDMVGHYKRSKFLAEQEVRRLIAKGLPAVIVNPTAPIGAMDRKPTPTGKIIVDFLTGKMPAYLDTGLNFVDVEDVAEAHVLASMSGVVGESYILGNANLTLKQFLQLLARLTGRKPPRWKLPYTAVLCLAFIDEGLLRLSRRREPVIPLDGVRMARHYMFFDCSKAVRDLGMAQNSLEIAALKAIDWYRGSGHVSGRSSRGMRMTEKEPDSKTGRRDRRLGDEWLDWNGSTSPHEDEIDEKLSTFLTLAAGSILIFIACLQLGWYLTKPRIDQISPLLSRLIEWSALVLAVIILILAALETTLLLKFRKSVFPYIWAEKLLLSLLSKSMWLGEKLGISRDRVGNSFIKAHNLIVKSHARRLNLDKLLILLPRCLEKEAKRQVVERANGRAVQIVTAAGGEEARKAIKEHKPSLILAVACERDLISGIRDVAEKIPVLAIPNKRPEGPCKNTHLRLDALDDALTFITGMAGKTANP